MKLLAIIFALLLSGLASAGVYEDLEEALIQGDSGEAIQLINRGVDINTVDREGNSLLTQAIRNDLPELFDFLMQRRPRLNTRNRHGETALSIAAYKGKLAYVQRLVEAGAEVNFFGWTPLAYAAFNGHLEVADYLLKHGAEIDAKTANGSTALFFAARFDHIELVRLLLGKKADPNILNENDESAIDWALKGRNTDIEALLRAAGGRSGQSVMIELSK